MRWSSARLTDLEVDAQTPTAVHPRRLRQGDFPQSRPNKVFPGGRGPGWLKSRNGKLATDSSTKTSTDFSYSETG